jgi:hypothetical protein
MALQVNKIRALHLLISSLQRSPQTSGPDGICHRWLHPGLLRGTSAVECSTQTTSCSIS